MPTVTYTVPAGHMIRVTASAVQDGEFGGIAVGAGETVNTGPFNDVRQYEVTTNTAGAPLAVEVFLAVATGTVAAAGSSQGTAAPLPAAMLTVVTAADGTKGVRLPPASAGLERRIVNSAGSVLKVYPAGGGAINSLATDAAISMAANTAATFAAYDGTTWYTIPTVPS